jgi:hypothetical protein|nr:MAG TPA: Firmicute plasmid replication protein (RepL) [Caudoviricetes sp.]
MPRARYENHVLRTYVDKDTGEFIYQDEFVKISGQRKLAGFRLAYMGNIKALILQFGTTRELYIALDIISSLPNKLTYDIALNVEGLAKHYKVKPWVIRRVINTLKRTNTLEGSRGKYTVNPFFIVPKYMDDDLVYKAQKEWEKKYGKFKLLPKSLKPRHKAVIPKVTPEEAAGRSMNSPV